MTRRRPLRALIACMNHLERQSLALMLAFGVLACAGSTKQQPGDQTQAGASGQAPGAGSNAAGQSASAGSPSAGARAGAGTTGGSSGRAGTAAAGRGSGGAGSAAGSGGAGGAGAAAAGMG